MKPSSEYVLMCEKATELQKQWHLQAGDYYYVLGRTFLLKHRPIKLKPIHKSIWLPRQDQLWGMLPPETTLEKTEIEVSEITREQWICSFEGKEFDGNTAEEALIQAVQYPKSWNGKEWIDATETRRTF